MATTPDGNYYAALPDPPAPTGFTGDFGSGVGTPGVSTPVTRVYTDTSNGDFYVNTDGTTGGWVKVGSAGGGAQNNNVIYVADPNTEALAPPDPTKAAFAYSLTPGLPLYDWKTTVPRSWF